MRTLRGFILFVVFGSLLASCENEESYPSRPITLLCPWSAGGGTDLVSRQLALYLEQELEVPVNVINATGGSGVTGHGRGARARPDGYTLLMMTIEINMLHWRGLTDLDWQSYTPLMLLNRDAAAVFVPAESPWKTLKDLEAEVRKNPGKLRASGTATGGIWHLALAGWLTSMDLPADAITWVPHGGAGPSLTDLASRGLDVVCCSVPEARSYLQAKSIRCLGVMSKFRVPGFEELPTFPSLGVDWTTTGWRGLAFPKDTPKEVVDTILPVLERILRGEAKVDGKTFPDFMKKQSLDVSWEGTEGFTESLKSVDEQLGKLLLSDAFASLREEAFPPFAFPGAIALVILLSGVAYGLRSRKERPPPDAAPNADTRRQGLFQAASCVVAVLVYVAIAETLGFVLTMAALLTVLFWRFGTRAWVSACIACGLAVATYQLFAVYLRVPLPRGFLGW